MPASQNMTFEASVGLRKKHLAALYSNASETFKDEKVVRLTQAALQNCTQIADDFELTHR